MTRLRPGRGSIVFAVIVGDTKLFESAVMREGMLPQAVQVDLNGATEFILEVTDSGDGIACDQADWADAKVTLSDLTQISLGDMEIVDSREKASDTKPFFSFVYAGQPSSQCLDSWNRSWGETYLDADRTQHTLTYTDPQTGLVVRCDAVKWENYPIVEWTLYFKNEGATDTPLIESIQALDVTFERGPDGEYLLHHHRGDDCSINSFAPLQTILGPQTTQTFTPVGGRPTNGAWPYFNLERPDESAGVIIAIGWPGQWTAQFARDDTRGLRVTAGQELTRFKLHPGEEIRTPLIVLQFYKGSPQRAQNIWRRWMLEHNLPKDHGKPLAPKLGAASVQYYGFNCDQAGDIAFINRFVS